jgi:hypothetical protein
MSRRPPCADGACRTEARSPALFGLFARVAASVRASGRSTQRWDDTAPKLPRPGPRAQAPALRPRPQPQRKLGQDRPRTGPGQAQDRPRARLRRDRSLRGGAARRAHGPMAIGSPKPPGRFAAPATFKAPVGPMTKGAVQRLNAGLTQARHRGGIRPPPRKARHPSLDGPTASRSGWRGTADGAGPRSLTKSAPRPAGERRAGAPASRAA